MDTELNQNLIKAKDLWSKKSYRESLDCALNSAGKGHAESQVFVGWLYLKGEQSIERNLDESIKWLSLAANSGSSVGHYLLGIAYYYSSNYDQALTEFTTASKMNYFAADYQIGKMYYSGVGTQKDIEKSYEYFLTAKNQGHLFAGRQVAVMLMKGHKGVLNIFKGFVLFITTIVSGFILAFKEPDSEKLYE